MTGVNIFVFIAKALSSIIIVFIYIKVSIAAQSDPYDQGIRSKLEHLLSAIDVEDFARDPVLKQHVDRGSGTSSFTPISDSTKVFYQTDDTDSPDNIILSPEDDLLKFNRTKRLYIGLKKSRNKEGRTYYATFAFLNDEDKEDRESIKSNGKVFSVEWSTYSQHVVPGRGKAALKSVLCLSSYLVPCFVNLTWVKPDSFAYPKYLEKVVGGREWDEIEALPFILSDGFDQQNNLDFYRDLYTGVVQGRSVAGGLIGNVLAGVGDAACALLGLVIGPCEDWKPGPDDEVTILHRYVPEGYETLPDYYTQLPEVRERPGPQNTFEPVVGALNTGLSGIGDGVGGFGESVGNAVSPIGGGLALAVNGKKKREVKANVVMSEENFPGWKTQYRMPHPGILFQDESTNIPFYGLGGCPYIPLNYEMLASEKGNMEAIIQFYLNMTRVYCISFAQPYVKELVESSLLSIQDLRFTLNSSHPFIWKKKVSMMESTRLRSAVDLWALSTAFLENKGIGGVHDTKTKFGQISSSVHIFVSAGHKIIAEMKEIGCNHVIFLRRTLLLNTENAIKKVNEDRANLALCEKCEEDVKLNENDLHYLMAFSQFIRKGLEPVDKGHKSVSAFHKFASDNYQLIKKYIEALT